MSDGGSKRAAIEAVWRNLQPGMTLEQFSHVVNADPKTHGFTYREFAAERLAVAVVMFVLELKAEVALCG